MLANSTPTSFLIHNIKYLENTKNGENMKELITVILRTILILIITFALFKLMGKKQVSQMNMFDYIIGITLGSIAADISLDIEKDLLAGIICILIYVITSITISYLSLKGNKMRIFLNGKEEFLIKDGKINRENLNKNRITINTLLTEARLMGHFNLDEINTAILEPNGKISFKPITKEKTITKKDLKINSQEEGTVYNLIIDSELIKENLKSANITEKWLNHELKVLGKNKDNILLLTIDAKKQIKIYPK